MRRLLVLGFGVLWLAACAVQPPESNPTAESLSVAAWEPPEAPGAWTLSGRASLAFDDEAGTASLRWQESTEGYQLDLRGALGSGRLRLVGQADTVTLTTADGEQYTASSPTELVRAVTGYNLPVGLLRWWVRGQPVPWMDGEVSLDAQGRAVALDQGGWRVRYARYARQAGYWLPARVEVRHEAIQMRLVIRDWQVEN